MEIDVQGVIFLFFFCWGKSTVCLVCQLVLPTHGGLPDSGAISALILYTLSGQRLAPGLTSNTQTQLHTKATTPLYCQQHSLHEEKDFPTPIGPKPEDSSLSG